MLSANEKYEIVEKEVAGAVQYQVQLGENLKSFDNLLEAKIAIKTFKMGAEFSKHTGMEIFIEKE